MVSGANRLACMGLRLRSSDFAYDGMQFGTGTEQLPTNEQPFSYSLAVFGVSFIHRLW